MSHITHMNESRFEIHLTNKLDGFRIYMYIQQVNESRFESHRVRWLYMYIYVYICIYSKLDGFRTATHSYVWCDSFKCVAHLARPPSSFRVIYVYTSFFVLFVFAIEIFCRRVQMYKWHGHVSAHVLSRLIHMWDMTHSYVWHDSFPCVCLQ